MYASRLRAGSRFFLCARQGASDPDQTRRSISESVNGKIRFFFYFTGELPAVSKPCLPYLAGDFLFHGSYAV